MNEHTISLSDNLESFAQNIMKEQGYSDINQYISELIDRDRSKKLSKEPTDVEKLKLFNKKAQRLENSQFMEWMIQNRIEINISNIESNSAKFPPLESLEAFILTFRLFTQFNDYIAVRNLNKAYQQLNLPQELKEEFFNIRKHLNKYLDSGSTISKGTNEETLNKIHQTLSFGKIDNTINHENNTIINFTKREILNFFIYGELAHITQKEDYEDICKSEIFELFSMFDFLIILRKVTFFLFDIKTVNEKAIEHLEKL